MPGNWSNDPDSVLRGLFGSLVSGAASGMGAANMWNSLREGAYSWAESVLSVTSPTPPTEAEIQAAGQDLIGHVTIMDMNRYVSLAHEYLTAKNNLQTLGLDNQIEGTAIFRPPWATSVGNPAVPERYRIRVLRSITVHGFTTIERNEWSTYEITSPLTSVQDALDQANQLFSQADYNSRADINEVLDYTIEAV